jgi:hypothetical protein
MASDSVSGASNQQDSSMIENEETVAPMEPAVVEAPPGDAEGESTGDTNGDTSNVSSEAPADSEVASGESEAAAAPADPAPAETPPSYQRSSLEEGLLAGFKHRLEEYCTAMGRGVPITAVKGSVHQLNLYRLFLDILRQDGNLFTKAWSDLLAGIHAQRDGCFDTLYAARFINEIKSLSKPELRVFMNLMHLARITADRKSRMQMLKTVDFTSVTSNIPVPGAFEKLHGFYYSA